MISKGSSTSWISSLAIALLVALISPTFSQAQDTLSIEEDTISHSPRKATLLSTFLPGAGQAYNKKYWKMPIVYAGLGVSVFFIIDNNKNYNLYRDEYLSRLAGNSPDPELEIYSDANLVTLQDTYRRWRDLSYVSFTLIYVLQIVDAAVDAHFFEWDKKINDDLSIHIAPHSSFETRSTGLKIGMKF